MGKQILTVLMVFVVAACAGRSSTHVPPLPQYIPPPPTQLVISEIIGKNLDVLAEGMRREYAVCLMGKVRGDTAYVTRMEIPEITYSDSVSLLFGECPQGFIAVWHNHPAIVTAAHMRIGHCALSAPDMETAIAWKAPFMVVQVRDEHRCYWSLKQIRSVGFFGRMLGYLGREVGTYEDRRGGEVDDG